MADLQRRHQNLIHGRVTLTKNLRHKKLANVAEALIVVTLPGRHTMTSRKEDKTFEEAIRTAFDAMAIELRKQREKRSRSEVRTSPLPPLRGVICKRFPRNTDSSSRKAAARCTFINTHCRISRSINCLTGLTSPSTLKRARKALRRRRSIARPLSSRSRLLKRIGSTGAHDIRDMREMRDVGKSNFYPVSPVPTVSRTNIVVPQSARRSFMPIYDFKCLDCGKESLGYLTP